MPFTPTNNKAAWTAMRNFLSSMGGVTNATIGEPKSKMQSGTVAIIPESGHIDETTLTNPREVHMVTLRHYIPFLEEPQENIEFKLDDWRARILADIFGDFDLGGAVAYALPTQTSWTYGYQTVDNTVFRMLDISLAFRVDDNAPFG